jgi:hypothetical protein
MQPEAKIVDIPHAERGSRSVVRGRIAGWDSRAGLIEGLKLFKRFRYDLARAQAAVEETLRQAKLDDVFIGIAADTVAGALGLRKAVPAFPDPQRLLRYSGLTFD